MLKGTLVQNMVVLNTLQHYYNDIISEVTGYHLQVVYIEVTPMSSAPSESGHTSSSGSVPVNPVVMRQDGSGNSSSVRISCLWTTLYEIS